MFWSTLGRMIIVPIAFLVAAASSLIVLLTLGYERIVQAMAASGTDIFEAVFDLVGHGAIIASGLTVLPALALVVIGEVARVRSVLYYMLGGGAALAAIPLIARFGQRADTVYAGAAIWQIFATAGFVGGIVYWLLAGRRA